MNPACPDLTNRERRPGDSHVSVSCRESRQVSTRSPLSALISMCTERNPGHAVQIKVRFILLVYCWYTAGILLVYCRYIVGIFMHILLVQRTHWKLLYLSSYWWIFVDPLKWMIYHDFIVITTSTLLQRISAVRHCARICLYPTLLRCRCFAAWREQ